ncbi:hypothetical protein C8Q73DRAFT_794411 [Cubamyces lactineus]|nr:hypothetical protein C8Q73DRAFT_794411 [Cubamyces lactineus]
MSRARLASRLPSFPEYTTPSARGDAEEILTCASTLSLSSSTDVKRRRTGGRYRPALAYAGTSNNAAIRQLLHVAVSDTDDDVRRAVVTSAAPLIKYRVRTLDAPVARRERTVPLPCKRFLVRYHTRAKIDTAPFSKTHAWCMPPLREAVNAPR